MALPIKLLVLGINYAPELIGIGKYTGELCAMLARRGHQVRVITAPPYYPDWKVSPPYSARARTREHMHGVEVVRCPLYVPKKPNGVSRIGHHLSFAAASAPSAIRAAYSFQPDVVLSIAPSMLTAPCALLAARIANAASWLHVQDFEVDAAFELGILKGTHSRASALWLERKLLNSFDRVSSISPNMVRALTGKGVDPRRAVELRNWVDTSQVKPQHRATSFRRRLGLDEQTVVALYSGNMAAKQGLEDVAQAARWLSAARPRVAIVFCGSGSMGWHLRRSTADLPNVHFLELQPLEKLSELLATADIHLLPQRAEAADLMLPSKMTAMLASGRPIVAMAHAGTGLADELDGAAIVVPPGSPEAFGRAVADLADDPMKRFTLGAQARARALERWDADVILDNFEQSLVALAKQRNTRATPIGHSVTS